MKILKRFCQKIPKRVFVTFSTFVVLEVILRLMFPGRFDFSGWMERNNIQWWFGIGRSMRTRGFFNVWTPYPPLFPTIFYGFFSLSGDNILYLYAVWIVLNIALLLSSTILVYLIVKELSGRFAVTCALNFFLFNMSWHSQILIGIKMDQFDYLPIFLLLFSFYMLLKLRVKLSSAFCAAGTMTKIFPGIMLPLSLIYFWKKRERGRVKVYVILFLFLCALAVTPFLIVNPEIFLSTLFWSLERRAWETPFTYPSISFPPEPNPFTDTTKPVYGTVSAGPDSLTVLQIGLLLLTLLFLFRYLGKREFLSNGVLIFLLSLLMFSRGISSYFIFWLFPWIAIVYPIFTPIILAALLFVGSIEFLNFPSYYWHSIFSRHIILTAMLIHQLFVFRKSSLKHEAE